jgi:hypothetical protein
MPIPHRVRQQHPELFTEPRSPTPDSDAWAELNTLSRGEVSQATGMLVAQLEVEAAEALVRLRAHAYATGRSATDVARDILDRRLRLEASWWALIFMSDTGSVAYRPVTGAEWSR